MHHWRHAQVSQNDPPEERLLRVLDENRRLQKTVTKLETKVTHLTTKCAILTKRSNVPAEKGKRTTPVNSALLDMESRVVLLEAENGKLKRLNMRLRNLPETAANLKKVHKLRQRQKQKTAPAQKKASAKAGKLARSQDLENTANYSMLSENPLEATVNTNYSMNFSEHRSQVEASNYSNDSFLSDGGLGASATGNSHASVAALVATATAELSVAEVEGVAFANPARRTQVIALFEKKLLSLEDHIGALKRENEQLQETVTASHIKSVHDRAASAKSVFDVSRELQDRKVQLELLKKRFELLHLEMRDESKLQARTVDRLQVLNEEVSTLQRENTTLRRDNARLALKLQGYSDLGDELGRERLQKVALQGQLNTIMETSLSLDASKVRQQLEHKALLVDQLRAAQEEVLQLTHSNESVKETLLKAQTRLAGAQASAEQSRAHEQDTRIENERLKREVDLTKKKLSFYCDTVDGSFDAEEIGQALAYATLKKEHASLHPSSLPFLVGVDIPDLTSVAALKEKLKQVQWSSE